MASSEVLDVLHRAMCPVLYHCIAITIGIASNLPAFFVVDDLLLAMKGGRTQREEEHEGRKDTKGGRTQREEGHKGRKDTKGGRTGREGGHENSPLSTLFHLSLLPLDTFLVARLYGSEKHQTQRQKKEFSKPDESGGNPNPPRAPKPLNGSEINLNLNLNPNTLREILFFEGGFIAWS